MSIKNGIKQPGPVGVGLVPVQSDQGRSGPVGAGAGAGWCGRRCRYRLSPVPTGGGDRPQETLYFYLNIITKNLSDSCYEFSI